MGRPKTQIPTPPGNSGTLKRGGFSNLPATGVGTGPRPGFSWADGMSPSPIPPTNGLARGVGSTAKLPDATTAAPKLTAPPDPRPGGRSVLPMAARDAKRLSSTIRPAPSAPARGTHSLDADGHELHPPKAPLEYGQAQRGTSSLAPEARPKQAHTTSLGPELSGNQPPTNFLAEANKRS
jgi:hypothetical protein